jgi:hypothetical protein
MVSPLTGVATSLVWLRRFESASAVYMCCLYAGAMSGLEVEGLESVMALRMNLF